MAGLISYGAYVPSGRLQLADITAVLGSGPARGSRAVAWYDEDSTSMGVAAAREALASVQDRTAIQQLIFATAAPAYQDKANATAILAATGMAHDVLAFDAVGSIRSGIGAFAIAAQSPASTLVVLSDMRGGFAGGADEREGGDAAAAFVFAGSDGAAPVIAELRANVSLSEEFLEHWRVPGSQSSQGWEERFGAEVFAPLVREAVAKGLAQANIQKDSIDHLVVSGLNTRAVKEAIKSIGAPERAAASRHLAQIGSSGVAQFGVELADVFDRAEPGQNIVVVALSDGVTVLVLQTTEALRDYRMPHSLVSQAAAGHTLSYATCLTWRKLLQRDGQRRASPAPAFAPPAFRRRSWKFGLIGGRCGSCGRRQVHPGRVCAACGAVDAMTPEPMADVTGKISFQTLDRLAYSPGLPLIMAMVDFEGGGRLRCQLTDVGEDFKGVGQPVEMTFRRLTSSDGIQNYFWKARPLRHVTSGGA